MAIWLGQSGYFFSTHDDPSKNPNIYKSVPYGDIEGVWTYIYFSYSGKTNTAVGLIKYTGEEFKRVEIPATHEKPTFLRFVLGGNDVGIINYIIFS